MKGTPFIRMPDGGYMLNSDGILYAMWRTDLADIKPTGRPRLRAFQERARGLVEAESIRANPRPVLDILADKFGAALERAMVENKFDAWLDGFLAEQTRGLS